MANFFLLPSADIPPASPTVTELDTARQQMLSYSGMRGSTDFTAPDVAVLSFTRTPSIGSVESPNTPTGMRSSSSIIICKKLPWPREYVFPLINLSAELRAALKAKVDLRLPSQRYQRGQLIQVLIQNVISNYTLYPTCTEKKDMARSIIKAFPHLQEEQTTGGYGAWFASIVDALKNRRRDLKDCPEVASRSCMTPRRIVGEKGHSASTTVKEKGHTSSTAGLKDNSLLIVGEKENSSSAVGKKRGIKGNILSTRKRKRGGISENWQPEDIEGEDEASCNKLIADMKAIMQKSESGRDMPKLKDFMHRTYSFRRRFLNTKPRPLLSVVVELYPALFTFECVTEDFDRLTGKSKAFKSAAAALGLVAPSLIILARNGVKNKLKNSEKFRKFLDDLDEANEDGNASLREINERVAALCLLPILLDDEETLLYQQYEVSMK